MAMAQENDTKSGAWWMRMDYNSTIKKKLRDSYRKCMTISFNIWAQSFLRILRWASNFYWDQENSVDDAWVEDPKGGDLQGLIHRSHLDILGNDLVEFSQVFFFKKEWDWK